jgi:hypothetical protein
MILCHKCSGILASADNENTTGLLGCGCISGYVRGFEPYVTRQTALAAQINQQQQRILLYQRQSREQCWIDLCQETINRLNSLTGEQQ